MGLVKTRMLAVMQKQRRRRIRKNQRKMWRSDGDNEDNGDFGNG